MMGTRRCPITYESITSGEKYSKAGLKKLSRGLETLYDFPYDVEAQIKEAARRASKMSIQGVQPKLSVILNVRNKIFDVVDEGGEYIIKPPLPTYREVPENEDVSMRLAAAVGIDVPLHGLIYAKDQSLVYVIKRFDRKKKQKVPTEDFAQLMEMNRETKYNASMEKVAQTCEQYCTFPLMDKERLFVRTLFSFLIGNEDMHIKNFPL